MAHLQCVCVCVCVHICGSNCVVTLRLHGGTVDEGMLLPLTHLMICLLLCDQRGGEIPHNREAMSNTTALFFLVQGLRCKDGNCSLNNPAENICFQI